jgi:hypothetical protein
MPQPGCTSAQVLIIGSTEGGGRRRRRRRAPSDLGGHRPYTSAVDSPDDEDLHRSTGPILRIARAEDHHAAHLVDTFPCRASVIGTSINRSHPVGLWYATRSIEFVQQSGARAIRPLCRSNRQRPRTRVMGLDGQAKLLSGNCGRRGAVLRKKKQACTVRRWRSSKWRSKWGSSRSSDGGFVNVDEDNRADEVGEGSCGGGVQWCAVRVNPNRPIAWPLIYSLTETLCYHALCRFHVMLAEPLQGVLVWDTRSCGPSQIRSGLNFLQGNRPTTISIFFYFLF